MKKFLIGFLLGLCAGAVIIGLFFFVARRISKAGWAGVSIAGLFEGGGDAEVPAIKTVEERIAWVRERSQNVKALYMTADVARADNLGGKSLRENIIALAERTEINGIVIDVKEVCGPDYDPESLRVLLESLHQKNIWTIARMTVFKDASQVEAHPEWYVTRNVSKPAGDECIRKRHLRAKPVGDQLSIASNQPFWRDRRGGYWLDPASEGARRYILDFAREIVNLGFDELQFDYIRFPSDGDVKYAVYPSWDRRMPKYEVIRNFFEFLVANLKMHKPEIILSADLFGYVATHTEDAGIGQRLADVGDSFDYISFMVYPSHYYSGLSLAADPARNLSPVNLTASQARTHPDVVVERSLRFARDYLDGVHASSSATTTSLSALRDSVRLRPWLEDFFHEEDRVAGRPFGAQKVRMQIDAAERVEKHGWLLWNAANVYTEGALRKEEK